MNRYIKLDDIKRIVVQNTINNRKTLVVDLIDIPTIEIVECDECLHKNNCSRVVKNIDGTLTWLDWCSFGERKNNG